MSERTLFELPAPQERASAPPTRPEEARVVRPVREQVQWAPRDLEAVVPQDHPARAIWGFLESLELRAFYGSIKAVVDGPGRPTTDPQVLLALWLLATVEGVGSARKLARLCEEHDAYRWVCGGVPINYHMLSDFRVAHQAALDDLLTQIVASLMAAGAVTLERVAQDGMRVRASAGASSFRRRERLEQCLEVARTQVKRLAQEREHPDPGVSQRAQAVKQRQQQTRALAERAEVTEPRTSTTDPEARVMKMPDGGFRPAYNVELATDAAKGIIVGVAVTPEGTDASQAVPMEEQVVKRTGQHPKNYLMDSGFAARDAITILEGKDVTVYAPVRRPKSRPEAERYEAKYDDSPAVVQWRQRMATQAAQAIYKQRGATAEWVNAQVRQHGVSQFTVRGIAKATTVMFLVAIAHNFLRWAALAT